MKRLRIRRRPSPAMIVAVVALSAALVGTAVAGPIAEISLTKKEKRQTKKIARQQANKVFNKRRKGLIGPAGAQGPKGDPGPLVSTLPSGKTLRGIYSYAGHKTIGYSPTFPISYQFPLATEPELNLIEIGEGPTGACPGSPENPQAAPGNLCVYEARNDSGTELGLFESETGGKLGAVLFADLPENVDFEFDGSWAVTAP